MTMAASPGGVQHVYVFEIDEITDSARVKPTGCKEMGNIVRPLIRSSRFRKFGMFSSPVQWTLPDTI